MKLRQPLSEGFYPCVMKPFSHTIAFAIVVGIAVASTAPQRCGAQVSAALLSTIDSSGNYTRPPGVSVELVSISDSGVVLSCTEKFPTPGVHPATWRERYSIRDGKLVLTAILTPHLVPPQPEHLEWDETPVKDSQLSDSSPATQPLGAFGQHAHPAIFSDSKARMGSIGASALDPKWGAYQPYEQRIIEVVQDQWLKILAENGLQPVSGSQVSVKFVITSKGEISRIVIADRSAGIPDAVARACVNAVTSRAPYGVWTPEMVAALGSEQEITLSFTYQ
jgi:hypothetical protein